MSDCLDAQILQHNTQGATRDAICRLLHVGPNRVSRVFGFFRNNHHLPPSPQKGRPKKVMEIEWKRDNRSKFLQHPKFSEN
jgi:hypothetical protein